MENYIKSEDININTLHLHIIQHDRSKGGVHFKMICNEKYFNTASNFFLKRNPDFRFMFPKNSLDDYSNKKEDYNFTVQILGYLITFVLDKNSIEDFKVVDNINSEMNANFLKKHY